MQKSNRQNAVVVTLCRPQFFTRIRQHLHISGHREPITTCFPTLVVCGLRRRRDTVQS